MPKTKDVGHKERVYIFRAVVDGKPLLKFGTTTRSGKVRVKEISGQSPMKCPVVTVIGEVEGGKDLEDKLHLILARDWSHGEWYHETPFSLGIVEEMKASADPKAWADAYAVHYPTPPPANNESWCSVVPVSVDGTARQRPVLGTSIPSLAVLKENLR